MLLTKMPLGSDFSADVFSFMLSLLLLNNVCVSQETKNESSIRIEGKIVGGCPVSIEKFPSAVLVFNLGSLCGGTIITSWTIISAAHCFTHNSDTKEITVNVGSRYLYDSQAVTHAVAYLKVHELYNNPIPFANDVALLFLEEVIKLGKKAKKAVLVNTAKFMQTNKLHFHATGWGWTKYGGPVSKLGLLMTHLEFVPLDVCSKLHDVELSPDMFCLYGNGRKDACKGDSGGGVLWRRMLVGIVSHGDGCAKKNKPSVFSNVYYFRSWIEDCVTDYFQKHCVTENGTKFSVKSYQIQKYKKNKK